MKKLPGECQQCGGYFQFPAEMAGQVGTCPLCREQTEFLLASPPEEPTLPRRIILWTLAAVLILALGLAGALYALRQVQHWAAEHKPTPRPPAQSSP